MGLSQTEGGKGRSCAREGDVGACHVTRDKDPFAAGSVSRRWRLEIETFGRGTSRGAGAVADVIYEMRPRDLRRRSTSDHH